MHRLLLEDANPTVKYEKLAGIPVAGWIAISALSGFFLGILATSIYHYCSRRRSGYYAHQDAPMPSAVLATEQGALYAPRVITHSPSRPQASDARPVQITRSAHQSTGSRTMEYFSPLMAQAGSRELSLLTKSFVPATGSGLMARDAQDTTLSLADQVRTAAVTNSALNQSPRPSTDRAGAKQTPKHSSPVAPPHSSVPPVPPPHPRTPVAPPTVAPTKEVHFAPQLITQPRQPQLGGPIHTAPVAAHASAPVLPMVSKLQTAGPFADIPLEGPVHTAQGLSVSPSLHLTQPPPPATSASPHAQGPHNSPAVTEIDSEYDLEDLDDDWKALLGDLDSRLRTRGNPTLTPPERAVAIKTLLVATGSRGVEHAMKTALEEVLRFRKHHKA